MSEPPRNLQFFAISEGSVADLRDCLSYAGISLRVLTRIEAVTELPASADAVVLYADAFSEGAVETALRVLGSACPEAQLVLATSRPRRYRDETRALVVARRFHCGTILEAIRVRRESHARDASRDVAE